MLTTNNQPQFTMPVTVNTAAIQGSLSATFVAKRNSELKTIEQECAADGSGITGFLKRVTVSLDEIQLPVQLPAYTDAAGAVDAVTDWPGVGPALQKAYYQGLWEEKEKN